MTSKNTILIIDDAVDFSWLLSDYLTGKGYEVATATTGSEGLAQITQKNPDLVLLDMMLPDLSGIQVVASIKAHNSDLPVIMVSCVDEMKQVIEAMKAGASDYIHKPLPSYEDVLKKVQEFLAISKMRSTETAIEALPGAKDLIGQSPHSQQLLHEISKIANSDSTVLLRGESGTGKSFVAELIHKHSTRKDKSFMTINCAAIPSNLLESELFGHEKGAFTGAIKEKIGKFEYANFGTIFLDEIGDLQPEMQVKLLRVIQSQEFERVGGLKTIKVNVRIIAATNRDLELLMHQHLFRADLFYRLNVLPLYVPALRERKEDIPLLTEHFINYFSQKTKKHFKKASQAVLTHLLSHRWTGNIRELQNVIERAVVVGKEPYLQLSDFMFSNRNIAANSPNPDSLQPATSLREIEHQTLMKALQQTGGNITKAAKILGISRETIYRRLKKHGIELKQLEPSPSV